MASGQQSANNAPIRRGGEVDAGSWTQPAPRCGVTREAASPRLREEEKQFQARLEEYIERLEAEKNGMQATLEAMAMLVLLFVSQGCHLAQKYVDPWQLVVGHFRLWSGPPLRRRSKGGRLPSSAS